MASLAADQNQISSIVTWLSLANRTSGSLITLNVPAGVLGIVLKMNVTAVPGVDTVRIRLLEPIYGWAICESAMSSSVILHYVCAKRGCCQSAPIGTPTGVCIGLLPSVAVLIEHSGSGIFNYSVTYQYLKQ
jgi:hypothetical protein